MTGYFFSACTAALTKKLMKPILTPCSFSNLLLEALAHLHHRRHVDFVERGQDRVGRLRLQQPLGDARAQPAHRHALLGAVAELTPIGAATAGSGRAAAAAAARRRRAAAARRAAPAQACGCRARRAPAEHVALGHAAVLAGALAPSRPAGRCRPSAWRRPASRPRSWSRRARRPRPDAGRLAGRRLGRRHALDLHRAGDRLLAFGVDLGDHFFADAAVAVVLDELRQHARRPAPAPRARPCRSRSRPGSRPSRPPRPGFFFHCSRVASATDSDSCGTLTSINAMFSFALVCSCAVEAGVASLGQDEALELAERLLEQAPSAAPGAGARSRPPATPTAARPA